MRTKPFLFTVLAALLLASMPLTNAIAEKPAAGRDSLSAVSASSDQEPQDTTFFYEGEDSDEVVVTHNDWDDISEDAEEMASELGLDTWWGKLLGGTLGLMGGGVGLLGGALAILAAIFVLILLFVIFAAPIWLMVLVILLIIKGTRGTATPSANQPAANVSAAHTASAAAASPSATTASQATPLTGEPQTVLPQESTNTHQEMWKSGIMWSCIGVGLVCVFLGIGLDGLWGIGVLVACIGVAKLIIATTSRPKY